jgi:hypothetical protein
MDRCVFLLATSLNQNPSQHPARRFSKKMWSLPHKPMLDSRHASRLKLNSLSREVVNASKKRIFAMLRWDGTAGDSNWLNAEKLKMVACKNLDEMFALVSANEIVFHLTFFMGAFEEYLESELLAAFLLHVYQPDAPKANNVSLVDSESKNVIKDASESSGTEVSRNIMLQVMHSSHAHSESWHNFLQWYPNVWLGAFSDASGEIMKRGVLWTSIETGRYFEEALAAVRHICAFLESCGEVKGIKSKLEGANRNKDKLEKST